MKRNKNLIPFSHEHHHGLKTASLIKKGAPIFNSLPNDIQGKRKYVLEFYENDLIRHFRNEEEVLYPLSKGKDKELDILWDQIKEEHKQIFGLIDLIKNSINIKENLHKLGEVLEEHIRKEERILFPMIEKNLTESELEEISKQS